MLARAFDWKELPDRAHEAIKKALELARLLGLAQVFAGVLDAGRQHALAQARVEKVPLGGVEVQARLGLDLAGQALELGRAQLGARHG